MVLTYDNTDLLFSVDKDIGIIKTDDERCPIPFNVMYRDNLTWVLYIIGNYGNAEEKTDDIHSKFTFYTMWSNVMNSYFPLAFKPVDDLENRNYAYGVMVDIRNTNVLMIDIDSLHHKKLTSFLSKFMTINGVIDIDIAISSREKLTDTVLGMHVYVGFDKKIDVTNVIKDQLDGVICHGYKSFVLRNNRTILRVSKKFCSGTQWQDTDIKWLKGYSKKGNIWLEYGRDRLIAPLITVAGASSGMIQSQEKQRLLLRG